MIAHPKHIPHWLSFSVISLLLALLVTACGGSSATSTPTPTPTPSPSPAPSQNFVTYNGNGYTINYPQGWSVTKGDAGLVTFKDPSGIAYLYVEVIPNPNGIVPASNQVNTGLEVFKSKSKNYQKVDIAPTTTLAGDTWSQGAATGDVVPSGQTSAVTAKTVIIADNHPASSPSTKGYSIAYVTGQQVFELANTTVFQPMLQSFKFS
jgi:hypothetical protein